MLTPRGDKAIRIIKLESEVGNQLHFLGYRQQYEVWAST